MWQNNRIYTNLVFVWYILTHFGSWRHLFCTCLHPLYDIQFYFIIPVPFADSKICWCLLLVKILGNFACQLAAFCGSKRTPRCLLILFQIWMVSVLPGYGFGFSYFSSSSSCFVSSLCLYAVVRDDCSPDMLCIFVHIYINWFVI